LSVSRILDTYGVIVYLEAHHRARLFVRAPVSTLGFDNSQSKRGQIVLIARMAPFLFRCPTSGFMVQGYAEDDSPGHQDDDVFEIVACHACGSTHLVNPKTGRTAGADDE
jgi:hypothetical protein